MAPNMVDTAAEEKAWKKAKARAAKEGHAEDWPYVVAIFQAMTGKKGAAKGARLDPSTGMGGPLAPIVDVLRKATVADEPDYTRDGDSNPFVVVDGLKAVIEKFAGESRHGSVMPWTYANVPGCYGADGEEFDCIIGTSKESPVSYVIDELDANGVLVEHKAMVGFVSAEDAARAYAEQVSSVRMGNMVALPTRTLYRVLINSGSIGAVPFGDILSGEGVDYMTIGRPAFTGIGPIASRGVVDANGGARERMG